MQDFHAVDEYLRASYGLDLEDVLCEGCLVGRLAAALAPVAKIIPRCLRSEREDDGGECASYEGVLILDEIWYRFACQIFLDSGGLRFLSDISAFAAVEGKVKLAVAG